MITGMSHSHCTVWSFSTCTRACTVPLLRSATLHDQPTLSTPPPRRRRRKERPARDALTYQLPRHLRALHASLVRVRARDPGPRPTAPARSRARHLRARSAPGEHPRAAARRCPPRSRPPFHRHRDKPAPLVPGPLCERPASRPRRRGTRLVSRKGVVRSPAAIHALPDDPGSLLLLRGKTAALARTPHYSVATITALPLVGIACGREEEPDDRRPNESRDRANSRDALRGSRRRASKLPAPTHTADTRPTARILRFRRARHPRRRCALHRLDR